jgi:hypothetical protein
VCGAVRHLHGGRAPVHVLIDLRGLTFMDSRGSTCRCPSMSRHALAVFR